MQDDIWNVARGIIGASDESRVREDGQRDRPHCVLSHSDTLPFITKWSAPSKPPPPPPLSFYMHQPRAAPTHALAHNRLGLEAGAWVEVKMEEDGLRSSRYSARILHLRDEQARPACADLRVRTCVCGPQGTPPLPPSHT